MFILNPQYFIVKSQYVTCKYHRCYYSINTITKFYCLIILRLTESKLNTDRPLNRMQDHTFGKQASDHWTNEADHD